MSNQPFSDDTRAEDEALVAFLRSHTTPVPPPSPQAEANLMAAIAAEPSAVPAASMVSRRRGLFIGLGLVVIGGLVWQVRQMLTPPAFSTAELIELESFVVGNWTEVGQTDDPFTDWPLLGEPNQAAENRARVAVHVQQ